MVFNLIFLLGLANIAVADLGSVGRCRVPFDWNRSYECKDLIEFCEENNGVWNYAKVTATCTNKDFVAMMLSVKPDCNKVADYISSVFYLDKCGKAGYYEYDAFYTTPENGRFALTEIGNRNNTCRLFNLAYVPHRMSMYYICSDTGVDCADHRYVMSQGKLTDEEECIVQEIESKYNFAGYLIDI